MNGVALCESLLPPAVVMQRLHALEAEFGRERRHRNQARPLDLDLIDYGGRVNQGGDWPRLPHPALAQRAFVLLPLADVAPGWRDPRDGRLLDSLIAGLDPDDVCRPLE